MSVPVVRSQDGQTALFGYGSLCSIASLERTLGRKYDGPFVNCQVEGWRRSWDVGMPNRAFFFDSPAGRVYPEHILYLNVRRDPASLLNGTLFLVDSEELKRFDGREWIYDRHTITDQLRGVKVEGGDAYLYVAKPEYIIKEAESPHHAAIRNSYIKILEEACRDLGEEFRAAYQRSTDVPSPQLIFEDQRDPEAQNPFARIPASPVQSKG
jgi:hypothetical protein